MLFSLLSTTNLSDIFEYEYSELIEVPAELFIEEIKRAILKMKKNNASELNKISNKVIYLIVYYSPKFIMRLFQVCLNQRVHSEAFKKTIIIILRKNGNKDYLSSKLYKFIALLNIFEKILKAVISNYIYFLVEIYTLLSNTQIETRRMKFTDTALQLIIKKIYAI
jgi:hypothetical protein